jgi:hypothetical protein
VLEKQAKSSDELMRRLIEKRDGKKLADSNVHPSSSSCAVNFAQINPQSSGTSAGGMTQPNLSAQPMNQFSAEPPLMVQLLLVGCHSRL